VRGSPSMARSIGKVTCCSTSCGAIPGASAMTVTLFAVRSGKASNGRVLSAQMPAARSAAIPVKTSPRRRTLPPMRRSTTMLFAWPDLGDGAEAVRTPGHDLDSLGEPIDRDRPIGERRGCGDRVEAEAQRSLAEVDPGTVGGALDRLGGEDRTRRQLTGWQDQGGVHPRYQTRWWRGQDDAHVERAPLGIECAAAAHDP